MEKFGRILQAAVNMSFSVHNQINTSHEHGITHITETFGISSAIESLLQIDVATEIKPINIYRPVFGHHKDLTGRGFVHAIMFVHFDRSGRKVLIILHKIDILENLNLCWNCYIRLRGFDEREHGLAILFRKDHRSVIIVTARHRNGCIGESLESRHRIRHRKEQATPRNQKIGGPGEIERIPTRLGVDILLIVEITDQFPLVFKTVHVACPVDKLDDGMDLDRLAHRKAEIQRKRAALLQFDRFQFVDVCIVIIALVLVAGGQQPDESGSQNEYSCFFHGSPLF